MGRLTPATPSDIACAGPALRSGFASARLKALICGMFANDQCNACTQEVAAHERTQAVCAGTLNAHAFVPIPSLAGAPSLRVKVTTYHSERTPPPTGISLVKVIHLRSYAVLQGNGLLGGTAAETSQTTAWKHTSAISSCSCPVVSLSTFCTSMSMASDSRRQYLGFVSFFDDRIFFL